MLHAASHRSPGSQSPKSTSPSSPRSRPGEATSLRSSAAAARESLSSISNLPQTHGFDHRHAPVLAYSPVAQPRFSDDENQSPSSPESSSRRQVQVSYLTPVKGSNLSEEYSPFDSEKDIPPGLRNGVVRSACSLLSKLDAAYDAGLEALFRKHRIYKKLNDLVDLKASHPFHGFNYDTLMQRVYQIEQLDRTTAREKSIAK